MEARNMNKAVAYVRCSTEAQVDSGLGMDDQRAKVEAYAKLRGLDLVEVIADPAVSGRKKPLADRPGGKRLLDLIDSKAVQHVLFLKVDRLGRDSADNLATAKRWRKKGVMMHVIDLGGCAVNFSSPVGKILFAVLSAAAEFEADMTSERTKASLGVKRARGERCCRPGRIPYGMELDPNSGLSAKGLPMGLRPCSEEQKNIRRILELRAQDLGIRQIARRLEDEGRTCRGHGFYHPLIAAIIRRHMPEEGAQGATGAA